jgi:hypothetical protein
MDIPLGGIENEKRWLAAIVAAPETKSAAVTTYTPGVGAVALIARWSEVRNGRLAGYYRL